VSVSQPLRLLGVAVQFLTRVPVPVDGSHETDLGRAVGAFPLVGVLVAGVGIGIRAAAGLVWEPVVATVMAVAATVVVTGAFHEDGLADAADGMWGGWTPQRRHEIMRDSRLGTYGTVALFTSLALRIVLLAGLDLGDFARTMMVGHVLGRASSLLVIRLAEPLAGGSGARLVGGPGPVGTIVASATVIATLYGAAGLRGGAPLAVACLVGVGGARLCRRRLGGVNGDALGAINQAVHVSAMAVMTAGAGAGQ
jgi:adenosylcobinamide-GDP ribazoletransferase